MCSLHKRLKSETADLHEILDGSLSMGGFVRPGVYSRFLAMHASVLPDLENHLRNTVEYRSLDRWEDRFRTHALRDDLELMREPFPSGRQLSFSASPGTAAGIAYVVEGSRIGGTFLHRQLSDAYGDRIPASFLLHGKGCSYWPSFLKWLSERDATRTYQEAAVRSARKTFEYYLNVSKEQQQVEALCQ